MAKSAPLSIDAEKRVKIIYHEEDGKTSRSVQSGKPPGRRGIR